MREQLAFTGGCHFVSRWKSLGEVFEYDDNRGEGTFRVDSNTVATVREGGDKKIAATAGLVTASESVARGMFTRDRLLSPTKQIRRVTLVPLTTTGLDFPPCSLWFAG